MLRRGRGPVRRPAPVARALSNLRRRSRDRGSVTAEFAVAMPGVVLLLCVGLSAVSAVMTELECVDAAREAARAAARGDSGVTAGQRAAPTNATVSVSNDGDTVRATVSAPVAVIGDVLPALRVSGTAVAESEPGASP